MRGNVSSSLEGSLTLRFRRRAFPETRQRWRPNRSEVDRRRYERRVPKQRGRGMRKYRPRQSPRGSNVRRTSWRLHHQTVGIFWSRCARLALAYRAVSNPTQNFFDLPDANVAIEKIERGKVPQRPVGPAQPLSRFFFASQCRDCLSADSGQS